MHPSRFLFKLIKIFPWFTSIIFLTTAEAQIRVMPLGDAVVLGTGSSTNNVGGFRDDLYSILKTNPVPFDFVGSMNDGVSDDPNHEGHAGAIVDEINQSLSLYLQQYHPHIVLIHLGTEDLVQNGNFAEVRDQLSFAVDLISNYSNQTEIFLAMLIPNRNPTVDAYITMLNQQLQSFCLTKQALGIKIYSVDLNNAFKINPGWSSAYMSDDNFPNDAGYSRMAQFFYTAMNNNSQYLHLQTFSDNFNGRTDLGPNWNAHPLFQIKNGELANTSTNPIWDNALACFNSVVKPKTIGFHYGVTADAAGIAETGAAMLQDSASIYADGYLVVINDNKLRLWSLVKGKIGINLENINMPTLVPQSGDHFLMNVEIDQQGYHFVVTINNQPVGTVNHITTPNLNRLHFAGVMLRGGLKNNIDDFYVSNVVDEIPPAAIKNLTVVRKSATVVQLQWTATGDDSLTGQAVSYDLRYAPFEINAGNFDQATRVALNQTPLASQSLEKTYITSLKANTQYDFAIKVSDDNQNVSQISNVVTTTTEDAVYYVDDFDRTDIGQQWQVSSGVVITNGALKTTRSENEWNSLAILKAPKNPYEVGLQFAGSITVSQIENVGVLFKLNADSPQTNGYMIQWLYSTHSFKLWSLILGVPAEGLNEFSGTATNLKPGDYLKVYTFSDISGHHFVICINNSYVADLVDANKILGNSQPQYCGVILHGNSSVAIENFFNYSPALQPAQLAYSSGNAQIDTVANILNQPLSVMVKDASNAPVYAANVHFTVLSDNASLFPPAFPDGTVYLEAEKGIPVAPMQIVADPDASGGFYIVTPTGAGDNGSIALNFYLPIAGNYMIWGRAIAPSDTEDSFFIKLDNQPEIVWDVCQGMTGTHWEWDWVSSRGASQTDVPEFDPYIVYLSEGFHTIIVNRREIGTKLDKLIFTKSSLFTPTGKEEVDVYPSDFSGIAKTYLTLGQQTGNIAVRAWLEELPGQQVDFQIQAVADAATHIVLVSGTPQTGKAGTALAASFVVRILDRFNNPVTGFPVRFNVVQANGHMVGAQPVQTDSEGLASATLVLGTDIPINKVQAVATGLQGSPVEFTATSTSGFPTKIQYVSGNSQSGAVGTLLPQSLVVEILDNENSPMSGYTVTFENRSTNGGSLSASQVPTGANGRAGVNFTLGTKTGSYQVAAVASGLQNSPILFNLTATAGPAYRLVKVSGDSALGVSSFPLTKPFVVQVVDSYSNAVAGVAVNFKVTLGDGYFQGDGTDLNVNTTSSGLASATLVLSSLMGNYTNKVKVEKTGLQGSPLYFVASALPPTASHLYLEDGNGQIGTVNQLLAAPFRVKVTNPIGDPIANHPVVFHVVSGSGIFAGNMDTVQTVATNSAGIAAVTLKCGALAGVDVNLVKATSQAGTMSLVGSPVWFKASAKYPGVVISESRGNHQTGLINTQLSVPLEVLVVDGQNNPVTGQQVTFQLVGRRGKLDSTTDTLLVKYTGSNGKASVLLTLGNENGANNHSVRISATDGFQPLQGSPVIFYASAAKTAATNLQKLDGDQQTGTVGQALTAPVRVKVTDAYQQAVANQEVQFKIATGGGRLSGAPKDTLLIVFSGADGIAQATWILGSKAGSQMNRLRVSANNGAAELSGSPLTFTAVALPGTADADSSRITATSPVIADGQEKSIVTVTLLDRFKNPIQGESVVLSASSEFVFIEQPTAVTNDSGKTVGHVSAIKSGKKVIYARDVNDNVLLNRTAEIEFIASQATRVLMTAGNEQHRNVGTTLANPLVVTVTDNFDNPFRNYPVTFQAKTANGYLVTAQPVYTDSLGMAAANYVLSDTPGNNIIEARAGSLEGSPVLFTAVGENNPARRIIYRSGNNQTGVVGQSLPEPFVVRVVDTNSNPVKNVAAIFEFTLGTGKISESQPVKSNQYGLAESHMILGTQIGTTVVSASSPGLQDSPIAFLVNGVADQAVQLDIAAGNPQQFNLQSQSQPLTVRVTDRYGNPVVSVPVQFSILNGSVTLPTPQPVLTDNQGYASARVVAGTQSGTVTVRAALVTNPNVKMNFALQVLPGTVANLAIFAGDQQLATLGFVTANPLQVLATDQYANPVPNVKVTFVVTLGDASVIGSADKYSDAEGVVSCDLQIGNNPGAIQLLANSTSVPGTLLTFHLTAIANQLPTLVDIPNQQIDEMEQLVLQISAADPDNDLLQLVVQRRPEGASVSAIDNVTWRFTWTPDYSQSGVYPVIFAVFDSKGGVARDTVSIEVVNVNLKPVVTYFSPPRDTSLVPGQGLTFHLNASDTDGDSLFFFWQKNGTEVSDSSTYIYQSGENFTGQEIITGFVTDRNDTLSHSWVITVKTAVELAEFYAQTDEFKQEVTLYWRTYRELDNSGFEIWRSPRQSGGYLLLTPHLIPSSTKGEYTFVDDFLQVGSTYYYKLVDRSVTGAHMEHGPIQASIPLPNGYLLEQNFPNPFALDLGYQQTVIKFQLPREEWISIQIFNVLGQRVRTLTEQRFLPGYQNVGWDGKSDDGHLVTSGIYYYEFRAGDFKAIKRLVLIR